MANKVNIKVGFTPDSGSLLDLKTSLDKAIGLKGLDLKVKTQLKGFSTELNNLLKFGEGKGLGDLVNYESYSANINNSILATENLKKVINSTVKAIKNAAKNPEVEAAYEERLATFEKQKQAFKDLEVEAKKFKTFEATVAGSGIGQTKEIVGLYDNLVSWKQRYNELLAIESDGNKTLTVAEAAELTQKRKQLSIIEQIDPAITAQYNTYQNLSNAVNTNKDELSAFDKELENTKNSLGRLSPETQSLVDTLIKLRDSGQLTEEELKQINAGVEKSSESFKKGQTAVDSFTQNLQNSINRFIGFYAIYRKLISVFRESFNILKTLDSAFAEIAMVTNYTSEQVWKMKDTFVSLAKTTGMTLAEVTKAAGDFFKQGRSYSEVIKLTEAAGIAANIAGISATDSIKYLTSAVNGYNLAASQAMTVSDKFAELAAKSATDYEELAIALSKVAAQAYSAGVNMDNMMGFIAKALEVTREAPENIGTAFKTIFARMSELKDFGKTVEDGMDINRVDTALSSIGVSLTNQNKELRNLDEVLIDVGYKWKDLTKNQKAYIATALAGTRQQTRLLAVFEDFDRTMELAAISADSLGASYAMQEKYYGSIAYSLDKLTTSWQDFISSMIETSIIRDVVNIFTDLVNAMDSLVDSWGAAGTATLATGAIIGSVLVKMTLETFAAIAAEKIRNTVSRQTVSVNILSALSEALKEKSIKKGTVATIIDTITKQGNVSVTKEAIGVNFAFATSVAAVVAAVAAIAIIAVVWYKLANAEKLAKEKFDENQKAWLANVNNINKSKNELQGLIDQYDELSNKIIKTTEDETKLLELRKKMVDVVGEETDLGKALNNVLDLDLPQDLISDWFKQQADDINMYWSDIANSLIGTFGSIQQAYEDAKKEGDSLVQSEAIRLEALRLSGETSMDAFNQLTAEQKKYWAELARTTITVKTKLQFEGEDVDLEKTLNDQTKSFQKTFIEEVNKGGATKPLQNAKEYYSAYYKEYQAYLKDAETFKQITWNPATWGRKERAEIFDKMQLDEVAISDKVAASVEKMAGSLITAQSSLKGFKEQWADLQSVGYFDPNIDKEVKQSIEESMPWVVSLDNVMQMLGNDINKLSPEFNYSAKELSAWVDRIENFEGFDKGVLEELTSRALMDGPTQAFNDFAQEQIKVGGNYYDLIKLQREFVNALDTTSIQDLSNMSLQLNSIYENFQKVNDMISGAADYNIEEMQNLLSYYPEMGQYIKNNGDLSVEEQQKLASVVEEQFKKELERKIIILKDQKASQQAELKGLQMLYDQEIENYESTGKYSDAVEEASFSEKMSNILKLRQAELETIIKTSKVGSAERKQAEADLKALTPTISKYTTDANNATALAGTLLGQISTKMTAVKSSISDTDNQIINLNNALSKIGTNHSLAKQTEDAKAYEAKLNDIYVLEQALAAVNNDLANYNFLEENAKTGEEWLTGIYGQNKALEYQNKVLEDLTNAQKTAQNTLYDSLGAAQSAVKIVNGRLVPVMSKYISLTGTEQEAIDSVVQEYNKYTDGIDDNSQALRKNTIAIEENLQKIEDKTVELYDLVSEAIKNAEEKKLKELQDSWSEEKRLLDKRKAAYEAAFSEEDYNQSLEDLNQQRKDIIKQLANLEGATDLNSLQKKKDLLQQKSELDKDYNSQIVEYNRDALLKTIDDQSAAIDNTQSEYEAAYDKRINDAQWLESQVVAIINGGLDSTIEYLKTNLPEYENAWSISKDNILASWTLLYNEVNNKVDGIQNNLPDFSNMLNQLKQAYEYVSNINGLSPNAVTPTNPVTPTTNTPTLPLSGNGVPTTTIYGAWVETARVPIGAGSYIIYEKRENQDRVGGTTIKWWTETRSRTVTSNLVASATQTMTAKTSQTSTVSQSAPSVYRGYASGGLVDYTGLAMLHGTPGRPERVLSNTQTALFDQLITNLETMKSNNNGSLSSNIAIDNITIQTPQLNTNTDFKNAGRDLAKELLDAINERGLALNKKR